jgi:hypothetical protein
LEDFLTLSEIFPFWVLFSLGIEWKWLSTEGGGGAAEPCAWLKILLRRAPSGRVHFRNVTSTKLTSDPRLFPGKSYLLTVLEHPNRTPDCLSRHEQLFPQCAVVVVVMMMMMMMDGRASITFNRNSANQCDLRVYYPNSSLADRLYKFHAEVTHIRFSVMSAVSQYDEVL